MIIEMRVYGTEVALAIAWMEDTISLPDGMYSDRNRVVTTEEGEVWYRMVDSFDEAFSTLQGMLWAGMYLDNSVYPCPKMLVYLVSRMRSIALGVNRPANAGLLLFNK